MSSNFKAKMCFISWYYSIFTSSDYGIKSNKIKSNFFTITEQLDINKIFLLKSISPYKNIPNLLNFIIIFYYEKLSFEISFLTTSSLIFIFFDINIFK